MLSSKTKLDISPCESLQARWLTAGISGHGLELDAQARAHVVECEACRGDYHAALEVAARIGRERRLAREESERNARRRERLRLARDARAQFSMGMVLRTVFVPALLIFFLGRNLPAEVEARARAISGTYALGPRTLGPNAPPQPLRRGDWIVTDSRSEVDIARGKVARATIEPDSRVCVEDRKLERLLFGSGTLRVEGTLTVTTSFGVVELLAAKARLRSRGRGIAIELESGTARLVDAFSTRELAAGELGWLGAEPPANDSTSGL